MTSIMRGGFPELVVEPSRDPQPWFAAYLQTYLEGDVRNIGNVGSLADFQRFLLALAARTAQLCNVSEIARDFGITVNTAKAWLSILVCLAAKALRLSAETVALPFHRLS